MRKYTDEELMQVLENIKGGAVYCAIRSDGYGVGKIYKTQQCNIGWQYFGQGANKMTVKDLRWLLEVIFKDTECVTLAKWSDYYIGYIPIDTRYKAMDYSSRHPNTLGL